MKDFIKRTTLSFGIIENLKKNRMFTPETARMLLSLHLKEDPTQQIKYLENLEFISKLFKQSPFPLPDPKEVDGLLKFGVTEDNMPVGLNIFNTCSHLLVAGQSGCGKTTVFKLLLSQALKLSKLQNNQ